MDRLFCVCAKPAQNYPVSLQPIDGVALAQLLLDAVDRARSRVVWA
jgi:hypothetical protein